MCSEEPNKTNPSIDELIESPAWVDHWGSWFGDLFRNCANRIGNAATKNFDHWFRKCLKEDRPYDQVVTEMITASAPNSIWMPLPLKVSGSSTPLRYTRNDNAGESLP